MNASTDLLERPLELPAGPVAPVDHPSVDPQTLAGLEASFNAPAYGEQRGPGNLDPHAVEAAVGNNDLAGLRRAIGDILMRTASVLDNDVVMAAQAQRFYDQADAPTPLQQEIQHHQIVRRLIDEEDAKKTSTAKRS